MQSGTNPCVLAYLWHGYEPPTSVPAWLHRPATSTTVQGPYTPEHAAVRLDALFDRLVSQVNPPYIVPISGGWDSRIILAALRERTSDIVAVTLGRLGQLDYEIGKLVADAAGVEHVSVCLDEVKLDWFSLCNTARTTQRTYMPDAYFIGYAYECASGSAEKPAIWSGFLGESLTGGHYHPSHQKEDAVLARRRFFEAQRRVPTSWLPDGAGNHLQYPLSAGVCGYQVREREFLDFAVRQNGCIAKIVLGGDWKGWTAFQGECYSGQSVIAPYADAEWASYWLGAPRQHHRDQKLYLEMAQSRFPDLMALPSKYSWGVTQKRKLTQRALRLQHGLRNRLHRRFPSVPVRSGLNDNYIDFEAAFRKRDDYATVMEKSISVLKERDATPWLDLDRIWREHYRGKRDHAQGLQVLLGLAVNLEVNG